MQSQMYKLRRHFNSAGILGCSHFSNGGRDDQRSSLDPSQRIPTMTRLIAKWTRFFQRKRSGMGKPTKRRGGGLADGAYYNKVTGCQRRREVVKRATTKWRVDFERGLA